MIEANKNKVKMDGDSALIYAEWVTITCGLYEVLSESVCKEFATQMLTKGLFTAVAIGEPKEEEGD